MAGLTGIGNIIGGVGNFATGIANTVIGSKYAKKNYELQRDMVNYQKELNRTIMQREDNAVQRRSKDIASAGGNPALAYMNGVSSAGAGGSVSSPQAPQYDTSSMQKGISDLGNSFNTVGQIEANVIRNKQMKKDIEKVDADISKTKAETMTEFYRRLSIIENTAKTQSEKDKIREQKRELTHNLDWFIKKDLPTNANMPAVMNYMHGFMEDLTSDTSDLKDKAMVVGEVVGAALLGRAAFGVLSKGWNIIKRTPGATVRAYEYIKHHGMINKRNYKDFLDYSLNGFQFTKKGKIDPNTEFHVKPQGFPGNKASKELLKHYRKTKTY